MTLQLNDEGWNLFLDSLDLPNMATPASRDQHHAAKAIRIPPPSKVAEEFHRYPAQLLNLWREFQGSYLPAALPGFTKKESLRDFCLKILNLNAKDESRDTTTLANLVNQTISQEDQEKFWNTLSPNTQNSIITQEKDKYGTKAFMHDSMPRIVTEKTREEYAQRIRNEPRFKDAGFMFLGLGFGGAAFLVKKSVNPLYDIPKYVLKVPATTIRAEKSDRFAVLEDEYKELSNLTNFSHRFARQTNTEDHYSQKLAYYLDQNGQQQYLGSEIPGNRVLATVLQEGSNIYDTALRDNAVKLANLKRTENETDPKARTINPFVKEGLADEEIVKVIRYYLGMANVGINFYDLFPHNMHYRAVTKKLSFLDSCSTATPGSIQDKILQARKQYSLDMCIFDLVTFLVMHEQQHAFTTTLRKNIRLNLIWMSKPEERNNADLLEARYGCYLTGKFRQLKRCLEKAVEEDVFPLDCIARSLYQLNQVMQNPSQGPEIYGEHYDAMKKDFTRITERGKTIIELLYNHFSGGLKIQGEQEDVRFQHRSTK